jgi:hypothetical protein
MDYPTITETWRALWQHAVARYQAGERGAATVFDAPRRAALTELGATPQEVYDFAEDYCNYGEPGFETFLLCAELRRQYHELVMGRAAGERVINPPDLPPKTEEVDGIVWLPRFIAKARAKLRGEMGPDLMYGCGGDRNFCRTHGIHLAEFLQVVWLHGADDAAIVAWVKQRTAAVRP